MSAFIDDDGVMTIVKAPVFVRTRFNYDPDEVSLDTGFKHGADEVSATKQSFAEDADINTIVRRFGLTGELPDNIVQPQFGDYEGVTDYHTAMNAVRKAAESFMELPAYVRSEFDNDPQKYLEFFADEKNRDRAVELGLVKAAAPSSEVPKSPPAPASA